ncbi:AAA family ATPase [Neolewinella agarilytica]|uniref:AAA domain-containing protein n=1 Tax=Neolewinella agarilytica TaxID=478744 RepID=A0A1H9M780_9BACT|nr:AAA family ATPase [Neolewinella agarilytica]SER18983.1 AAA domain-containing protein [Neolewinella agarilytica]
MRLKRLYLSKYKNLNDFALNFTGSSFIDVFVGKNGTGKSNMFEALIEIFRQLYEKDFQVGFDFELEYEIDGSDHFVGWEWIAERYYKTEDGERKDVKKVAKEDLPDNVILYYSGHNEKVARLIAEYETEFKRTLKVANEGDTREFIGIGKTYKSLLLSVLLLQPKGCKARKFICDKLGIDSVGEELHLVLKRPRYARQKDYDVDPFVPESRYWKALGITQTFLDHLDTVAKSKSERIRDEGYIPQGKEEYKDRYELFLDLKDFQKKFKKVSSQELFSNLDNLKTIEMLDHISLAIKLKDGTEIDVDQFSDGQFQSIYIYTVVELFRGKNCLTLLDEPDSFLHPEWQFDFLKQVFEIADDSVVNNHVLVTSHSAITLIPHQEKKINIFNLKKKKIVCHPIEKKKAIDTLSKNMIQYREDEKILSIIKEVQVEHKPVFFTEGSTDPKILKTAWRKLYDTRPPFHILYAFSCDYLRRLLQDERVLNEAKGMPIFGMFDFDKAYNEWKHILGDKTMLESDPYKGLATQVGTKNSYALMLPVPEVPEIERQVIKDKPTKTTFAHNSRMGIEHLFYGAPGIPEYFKSVDQPGGGTLLEVSANKTKFAEKIVPAIAPEHFEVFRPMFEFIKSKI